MHEVREAWMIVADAMKDKSYRAFPLGQEAGRYLRARRKGLEPRSYLEIESTLDKLARDFPVYELLDFEPPLGTERIEEFLEQRWGDQAPRTYNKNLSNLSGFFKWLCVRGRMHGDPTLAIGRAKKRDVLRTVFTVDQLKGIIAAQDELRDRVALRLLLHYGLRKGALRAVQFKHFDHNRRRLTIFTKRSKIRDVPIPQNRFWLDLERLILDLEAQPSHYLLCRQKAIPRTFDPKTRKMLTYVIHRFPEQPMGEHGAHRWWYRCLENAGIVEPGTTRGEKMHKARHTAGQRVLDETEGNLKATQKLLTHESLQTTGDVYVDWDIDQLAGTLAHVIPEDE